MEIALLFASVHAKCALLYVTITAVSYQMSPYAAEGQKMWLKMTLTPITPSPDSCATYVSTSLLGTGFSWHIKCSGFSDDG